MSQALLIPEAFSPSVSLHSGRPATTSLEVAKFFGKQHQHVMRSIDDLRSNTPESFSASNFGRAEYSDEQGKPRPMFILYRDGFMLLVMGYTGKKALAMKLAYIEAFNRMEEELARQKEADRNITQDIVDFPGTLSLTPSSVADRKPLRALVGSWAKLSNAPFDACWNQLKAAFNLANIKELPQEWIPDALAWVQARKEADRNITQDIVDFPGTLSLTPSSVADRKPLRALVGSWAKLSNAPFDACWNQLKAAFNLANIKELPQEWIPDALAWVQARIEALPRALPPQPERLPLYRNGCFYPPHRDRSHVPGPREAALLELWQDWSRREANLRQEFMAMLRELDARRGDLFSYAVSDLGRNADTMFSPQCLLDSLFQSRTEAEQRFHQALDDASLHLRLSLNVAVALGR